MELDDPDADARHLNRNRAAGGRREKDVERRIAVEVCVEDIDGDQADNSAPDSGAAYLFGSDGMTMFPEEGGYWSVTSAVIS